MEQYGGGDEHKHTLQQQSEPLLVSSTSDRFPPSGYRARGDDNHKIWRMNRDLRGWLIANWGLIFGSVLALILFLAFILSYKRPDVLLSAVGVTETSPSPTPTTKQDDTLPPHPEHILSYQNYTRFPLDPLEYKLSSANLNIMIPNTPRAATPVGNLEAFDPSRPSVNLVDSILLPIDRVPGYLTRPSKHSHFTPRPVPLSSRTHSPPHLPIP